VITASGDVQGKYAGEKTHCARWMGADCRMAVLVTIKPVYEILIWLSFP